MIEPFPLALLLSVLVFIAFRFLIRLKSSTLISATFSILAFSFLLPDVAGSDNIYYWGLIPNENFNQVDALRLHIFFSSLAILVLIMSFLEIILLTRKIRLTKSLNTIRNDQIPIETRYKTVFWLIGLSLVLLSIGLASGFLLDLNNVDYLVIKIVFTVLAWITYMTTFIRMRFYNLQTKFIVRYSFLSIIFIMVAFFVNI
jgi:ABC-type uncharacterized transport system permease subunit|tara:strand:- start:507 stop:1109 length:603 start_codon:yes stop_codon:yes gene_type:complete